MLDYGKYFIIIDKDRVLIEEVEDYHINVAQVLINKYFDSNYNIREEMESSNVFYPNFLSEKFSIVVVITNQLFSAMYIPRYYNDFQLLQIKSINEMIKEYRNSGIKYGLVPHFDHSVYYDIDEFLEYSKYLKR